MPNNLNELLQYAEDVIDNINNHKQAMVVRSVLKIWTTVLEKFLFVSWVGPVYLVIFSCWGGPVPYLELFWVGPVKKTTLYIWLIDHDCVHFVMPTQIGRVYYVMDEVTPPGRTSFESPSSR